MFSRGLAADVISLGRNTGPNGPKPPDHYTQRRLVKPSLGHTPLVEVLRNEGGTATGAAAVLIKIQEDHAADGRAAILPLLLHRQSRRR